jgi:hypothetical protein
MVQPERTDGSLIEPPSSEHAGRLAEVPGNGETAWTWRPRTTTHWLHALISLCTYGLWIPGWIVLHRWNTNERFAIRLRAVAVRADAGSMLARGGALAERQFERILCAVVLLFVVIAAEAAANPHVARVDADILDALSANASLEAAIEDADTAISESRDDLADLKEQQKIARTNLDPERRARLRAQLAALERDRRDLEREVAALEAAR